MNCTWCGRSNPEDRRTCEGCAASLTKVTDGVYADLTGVEGPVTLTIKKMPMQMANLLPGAI